MWVSLAQILVELQVGNGLGTRINGAESKDAKTSGLRARLEAVVEAELRDGKNDGYLEAIKACLTFGLKLIGTPTRERQKKARKLIRREIISNLQKSYEMWSSSTPPGEPDLCFTVRKEENENSNEPLPTPPTSPTRAAEPVSKEGGLSHHPGLALALRSRSPGKQRPAHPAPVPRLLSVTPGNPFERGARLSRAKKLTAKMTGSGSVFVLSSVRGRRREGADLGGLYPSRSVT
jgi:hypothetical protein